ncbi:MAG: hypothetical protein ACFFDN_28210 [Candidatus Hodarchaeota archaeon]
MESANDNISEKQLLKELKEDISKLNANIINYFTDTWKLEQIIRIGDVNYKYIFYKVKGETPEAYILTYNASADTVNAIKFNL